MTVRARGSAGVAACFAATMLSAATEEGAVSVREVFESTGVRGGLVVHLGCGTGEFTAALRAGEGYLVHGLDANPADVATARRNISELGLYGPVSIDFFDGKRLPYVDNLVNLIVSDGPTSVPSLRS